MPTLAPNPAVVRYIARLAVTNPEYLASERLRFLEHVTDLHPMRDRRPHPFAAELEAQGLLESDPARPGKLRLTGAGQEHVANERSRHGDDWSPPHPPNPPGHQKDPPGRG